MKIKDKESNTDELHSLAQIKVSIPDDFRNRATLDLIITHIDDLEALQNAYDMGHNIIVIDDSDSIVPQGSHLRPFAIEKHEIFLKTLCSLAENAKTTLAYEKKETLEFFTNFDLSSDEL